MEDGYRFLNTVTYGLLGRYQRTGRLTGRADGCGEEEIMSGYPLSPGDGPLIITADGHMLPVSDGFGCRRRGAKSTGGRGMSAGSGPLITSPGCLWHRGKCTTVMATTARTAW